MSRFYYKLGCLHVTRLTSVRLCSMSAPYQHFYSCFYRPFLLLILHTD